MSPARRRSALGSKVTEYIYETVDDKIVPRKERYAEQIHYSYWENNKNRKNHENHQSLDRPESTKIEHNEEIEGGTTHEDGPLLDPKGAVVRVYSCDSKPGEHSGDTPVKWRLNNPERALNQSCAKPEKDSRGGYKFQY